MFKAFTFNFIDNIRALKNSSLVVQDKKIILYLPIRKTFQTSHPLTK